jgi:homoserine kinase
MRPSRTVRIPASSSNLGPGFDALSFALNLYLTVEVLGPDAGVGPRVSSTGVDSEKMPTGDENLIARVMDRAAAERRRALESARLRVHNEIPLARGLGSSSTAILAGISCYEMLSGEELSDDETFALAQQFESHPDNLAAGFYGGLTVSASDEGGRVFCARVTVPEGLVPVLVIPEFELATEAARSVLPERYPRSDAVFNVQRAALLVAAMGSGRWDLIGEAMRDRIHQPYRAPLIPGLVEVLGLRVEGLAGSALSGAGPTVLALARPEAAAGIGEAMSQVFREKGITASVRTASIDTEGRRFLE